MTCWPRRHDVVQDMHSKTIADGRASTHRCSSTEIAKKKQDRWIEVDRANDIILWETTKELENAQKNLFVSQASLLEAEEEQSLAESFIRAVESQGPHRKPTVWKNVCPMRDRRSAFGRGVRGKRVHVVDSQNNLEALTIDFINWSE